MKNYIGVKIVRAKPGTMAEAQALKTKVPVEIQEKIFKKSGTYNEEGYIVQDTKGNISWIPKANFEREYRAIDCEGFICNE